MYVYIYIYVEYVCVYCNVMSCNVMLASIPQNRYIAHADQCQGIERDTPPPPPGSPAANDGPKNEEV